MLLLSSFCSVKYVISAQRLWIAADVRSHGDRHN